MISSEREQIMRGELDLKDSSTYRFLKMVSRVRQKDMARALGIANASGISIHDILNNPELQLQNLISPEEFTRLGWGYPEVKAFLEDPVHMAIVRERKNIDSLIKLQDTSSYTTAAVNLLKSIPRNLAAAIDGSIKIGDIFTQKINDGISQTAKSFFGDSVGQSVSDVLGVVTSGHAKLSPLSYIDWEAIHKSDILQRQDNDAPEDMWGKQFICDVIETAPLGLAQLVATYYKGNIVGALFVGSQIIGESYKNLTKEGVAPEDAYLAGVGNAFTQLLIDKINIGKVFKPIKKVDRLANPKLNEITETIVSEGVKEALKKFSEEAIHIAAKNSHLPAEEIGQKFVADFDQTLRRAGYQGLIGFVFGGVSGIGSVLLPKIKHGFKKQELSKVVKNTKNMPLAKKSPEVVENFLNKDGRKLYIDTSQLLRVQKLSKTDIIAILGYDINFVREAAAKGALVEVKYGTYVKAVGQESPEIHQALEKHIAFDEKGLTDKRIEIIETEAVQKAREDVISQKSELEAATESFSNELRQKGVQESAAQDTSSMLAAVAATQSTNPAQWIKDNAPKVSAEKTKGGQALQSEQPAMIMGTSKDAPTAIQGMFDHYVSRHVTEISAGKDAPEVLGKDRAALLEYAGMADWEKASAGQRKAAQEKWTQAAEDYVIKGTAPSQKLREVLSRFKKWQVAVYEKVKGGTDAVPLAEEAGGVFERLLTTERKITEMQYAEGYYNQLPHSVREKLAPAQQADLDKLVLQAREKAESDVAQKVCKVFTRDTKELIKAERPKVYQAALDDLSAQPVYQSIEAFKKDFPQKDVWKFAEEYRNKEAALLAGKEYKGKLSGDDALLFELLAETKGYSSGSELAARIGETPPAKKAAAQIADEYIKAKYDGVYQNKRLLDEQARELMYNDASAQLVATELQIAEEMSGKAIEAGEKAQRATLLKEQATQLARENVLRLPISEASRPQSYIYAERRAAERAAAAMDKGDSRAAFEQKSIQLYNHAMAQESLNVRQRFIAAESYLRQQGEGSLKSWSSEDNFLQAADIMRRFGFNSPDYDPALKRESLVQYAARQQVENPDIIALPEWLKIGIKESDPHNNLNIGDFEDVAKAVKNIKVIDRIGADSDHFAVIGGLASEKAQQLLLSGAKLKAENPNAAGALAAKKALDKTLGEFKLGHRKVTDILRELDGGKDVGPWQETIYQNVKKAAEHKSSLREKAGAALAKAFEKAGISGEARNSDFYNKIFIPEWQVSLSKMELRVIALNMGSKANAERLFARAPAGFDKAKAAWDEKTVKEVLGKHLSKKDFAFVQDVWQAVDLSAEHNKMATKMTGVSLPYAEATPVEFTLADGGRVFLSGGYYPLKQDASVALQAEKYSKQALGDYLGALPYQNTGAGKKGNYGNYAVSLDFKGVFNHIEQAAHDIAFRPVMHDLNKLARRPEIETTLRSKLGDEGYNAFKDWHKVVGRGSEAPMDKGGFDALSEWMRAKPVTTSLLFRPGEIVQNNAQLGLYGKAVQEFTEKEAFAAYTKRGVGDYVPAALGADLKRAQALREDVYSKSALMKGKLDKADFSSREAQEIVKERDFSAGDFNGAVHSPEVKIELTPKQTAKLSGAILLWADQLTDIPIWLGAYEKALAVGKNEKDAVHFADTVIERSTGVGQLKETLSGKRAEAAAKSVTMFTGFFNTHFNKWMKEYDVQGQNIDSGQLFVFMVKQYVAFGVLSSLYASELSDGEAQGKAFSEEVASGQPTLVPFSGSAAKVGLEKSLGFQSFGYAMPLKESLKGASSAAQRLFKEAAQVAPNKEADTGFEAFTSNSPEQINNWFFSSYDALFNNNDSQRQRRER